MAVALNSGSTSFAETDLTASVQLVSYTADKDYVFSVRVDLGELDSNFGLLSEDSSDTTIVIKAKIDGIEAYSKSIVKPPDVTQITYCFDRTLYLEKDEVLTVWAKSSSSADTSISGNVYIVEERK